MTCIKMDEDGGKKTFILDKKGGLTRGFSPDELTAHLPEMLRFQRRGENIYYTPLSDERHHILIDDMTRDSLKRLQEDGFGPPWCWKVRLAITNLEQSRESWPARREDA